MQLSGQDRPLILKQLRRPAQGCKSHLSDLSLLPCGSPPKLVKADAKPAVDVGVDSVVLVADLLAGQAFLQRLQTSTSLIGFQRKVTEVMANQ